MKCAMDLGSLLGKSLKRGGLGGALLGTTAAGLWWQLFKRPLPKGEGEVRVAGVEGTRRDRARPLGDAADPGEHARTTSGSGRASSTPRTACGSAT